MTKTWTHLHLPRLSAGEPECISVKRGRDKVFYVSQIALKNATFFVSAAGRERCLRDNVRNVHAWVVGEAIDLPSCFEVDTDAPRAIYDPWKGDTFVRAQDLTPIHSAATVVLSGKHVYFRE